MFEKILRFSLHYPIVVIVLTLIAGLYGVYSFTKLPIDAVPDITNNQVQINTVMPGFSPSQMEKQVTYVIETALAGVPGLEVTRSISRNAFSQVTAIFDESVNIYFARQQINERLSEIKQNLPDGADPKMGPISTGLGEIYMWTVDFKHQEGSYVTPEGQVLKTPAEKAAYLRTVQDWIIKPQLMGIPGLAGVDSIGGYVKQYHVEPNLEKMIALGLTFNDIIEVLKKNNVSVGPGYIEKSGESFLVKSDERLGSVEEIESIVISNNVKIRDIASVVIGKEMRTGSATANGHETVIGTAMMLIGSNSRTVSEAVDAKMKEINKTLPPDIHVKSVLNRTKLVNATIHTVTKNLAEGALLVIAVLFLFLGHFKAAFITALVIPLSMLLTATGMVQSKISGNLMSLGAIDFGLIVDGAVIITENCLRRLSLRKNLAVEERLEELMLATKEMIRPTVFGQLIIIVVYFPLLTLTGTEGKMFHPMAMTVIFALIGAFVLSLTFVPAMISLFIKGKHIPEQENKIVAFVKRGYDPLLDKALLIPGTIITGGTLLFLFSLFLFTQLGQEFVPSLDEKDIAMHAVRIPSTSLSQSTEMQRLVEKTLLTFPQVSYVFSKTGTAEMASDPMPPNVSDTFIILKQRHLWPDPHLSKEALIGEMEEKLFQVPGNNYEFTQPIEMRFNELISGVRSDVAIKIYGDDFSVMQKTAEHLASHLQKIPGAADIKVDQTEGLPVLDITIDRESASRLGVNVSDALETLAIAVGGGESGKLFEGDRRFDILVRLPEHQREDLTALKNLPIGPKRIPLGEIAQLNITEGLNEVQRENGKRFIAVQANVRNRDIGSFVSEAKQVIQKHGEVPKGYWLVWGGQFESLLSARQTLYVVVPLCLSLILFILYTAFGSLKESLIVFSGVPLALSGGIIALWLRDMPFSMSAAVGFIALSGIAVLNGLVLITCIKQHLQTTQDIDQSIREGALTRLRPVLMTALVASLGFIPMALATGTGAEVQKPLATVVIGGLLSSTLLTLVVLPAFCKCFLLPFRSRHIVSTQND